MKILLVCAGGMSTSILMQKMEKYWQKIGEELNIKAVGLAEYQEEAQSFDIIMVGPQVGYKIDEIKRDTNKPTEVIQSYDYAIGNCENIHKIAEKLYKEI